MDDNKIQPNPRFVFEVSWEVCNKVGGIYTVLSTKAKTQMDSVDGRVVFLGPDLWQGKENPLFRPCPEELAEWSGEAFRKDGLNVRVGRWLVPGEPLAILVDFQPFSVLQNEIYRWAWDCFGVDSLHAYGDYGECVLFSWMAGLTVESLCRHYRVCEADNAVLHVHEWQTALTALYARQRLPQLATVFTTHATTVGRSIACNGKDLYEWLPAYDGDQMAAELNVEAKHSVEKKAAWNADCFTTVSEITAQECAALIGRPVDAVLVNGFEGSFVPRGKAFEKARKLARAKLMDVVEALTGAHPADDALLVATGGRYEYRNKGIDLFVDAVGRLRGDENLRKELVAFVLVPAWSGAPSVKDGDSRLTHELHNLEGDNVISQLNWLDIRNRPEDKVKVVFVPCYLDGRDGIFNMTYYDLLIGMDLTVFPSYYEPWGYTPAESAAFHVPCVTTDLAGFGIWAESVQPGGSRIENGVLTIHRTSRNFEEASEKVKEAIVEFAALDAQAVANARQGAASIAAQTDWKHFFKHYRNAYAIAVANRDRRLGQSTKIRNL